MNPKSESLGKRFLRLSFLGALIERIAGDARVQWKRIVMDGYGQMSPAANGLLLLLRETQDLSEEDLALLNEIEVIAEKGHQDAIPYALTDQAKARWAGKLFPKMVWFAMTLVPWGCDDSGTFDSNSQINTEAPADMGEDTGDDYDAGDESDTDADTGNTNAECYIGSVCTEHGNLGEVAGHRCIIGDVNLTSPT